MAIIRDGYLGGFQGRMGPTVGYQWRGKWVVRTFSSHPRNPRTAAQQEHRMLFKQQVQLAGRLNWVLRETLDLVSMEHGMTPCNYFVMRNQEAFGTITTPSPLRGTPPQEGETGKAEQTPQSLRDSSPSLGEQQTTLAVDWERLVLSEGPVAPVAFGAPEVADGTTLVVPFERNPLHMRADNYDRVYIYVYCPEIERGFFSAPVYRREQRLAVVLPESFAGREVQVWGMVQDAAGRWSQTLYIGHGPIEDTETHPSVSAFGGSTSPVSGEELEKFYGEQNFSQDSALSLCENGQHNTGGTGPVDSLRRADGGGASELHPGARQDAGYRGRERLGQERQHAGADGPAA